MKQGNSNLPWRLFYVKKRSLHEWYYLAAPMVQSKCCDNDKITA